jgi:hypothetical protein
MENYQKKLLVKRNCIFIIFSWKGTIITHYRCPLMKEIASTASVLCEVPQTGMMKQESMVQSFNIDN